MGRYDIFIEILKGWNLFILLSLAGCGITRGWWFLAGLAWRSSMVILSAYASLSFSALGTAPALAHTVPRPCPYASPVAHKLAVPRPQV